MFTTALMREFSGFQILIIEKRYRKKNNIKAPSSFTLKIITKFYPKKGPLLKKDDHKIFNFSKLALNRNKNLSNSFITSDVNKLHFFFETER